MLDVLGDFLKGRSRREQLEAQIDKNQEIIFAFREQIKNSMTDFATKAHHEGGISTHLLVSSICAILTEAVINCTLAAHEVAKGHPEYKEKDMEEIRYGILDSTSREFDLIIEAKERKKGNPQ